MRLEKAKINVELKEELTWGEVQDIDDVLIAGVEVGSTGMKGINSNVIRDQKYKSIEVCIIKMTNDKGEEVKFSKEFMDSLSSSDGNSLEEAVDAIVKKK